MKSVIVIDTPCSCVTCPLSYYSEQWHEHQCRGREYYRTIDNFEWHKKQMCEKDIRPEWCPLVQLPEKIAHISMNGFYHEKGYKIGWNNCIDVITGERKENQDGTI